MIKISKNIATPPESLLPATKEFFPGRPIPRVSKTTHQRRQEIISNGSYINEDKFNSRYKYHDIKERLNKIYNSKCAFCEQKVEALSVDHYRPRAKYYWLAYSWDNLLLACFLCNSYKKDNFDICNDVANFNNSQQEIHDINNLSASYNTIEAPLLVNPETTDPAPHLRFTQDGGISSDTAAFAYTIRICKLDRKTLKDARRKLLKDLEEAIRAEVVLHDDIECQRTAIKIFVRNFMNSADDISNEFIAFRKFGIANRWLNDIAKKALSSSETYK